MIDDSEFQMLREWLEGREAVHDLIREWPPGCKVTSREDAPLMIPAPGIVGKVVSWFEAGTVGVVAPTAATVTSPITGYTAEQGALIKAECDPAKLEFLEEGEMTRADVAAALEGNGP